MTRSRWIAGATVALLFLVALVLYFGHGPVSEKQYASRPAKESAKDQTLSDSLQRLIRRRTPSSAAPQPPPLDFSAAQKTANTEEALTQIVEKRIVWQQELVGQSTDSLWRQWQDAVRARNEPHRFDLIRDALALSLHNGNAETDGVVSAMNAMLNDPGTNEAQRMALAGILAQAASPSTVGVLVQTSLSADLPAELRGHVLNCIAHIDTEPNDRERATALTGLLVSGCQEPTANVEFKNAAFQGIARMGMPEGVKLLLEQACASGATVREFEQAENPAAWAAYDALALVRHPDAVPTLFAAMQGVQPDSMSLLSAGHALSEMGNPSATAALIQWGSQTGSDVSALLLEWLGRVRDEGSLEAISEAVAPNAPAFILPGNKAAVAESLRQWQANHEQGQSR